MTSDPGGKRVNKLVENDQISEKIKSDFFYTAILKWFEATFLHGLDVEWKGQL